MIKLFSLKQDKVAAGKTAPTGRTSAAQLRCMKDHAELPLPSTCELKFDDPDDLLNFHLTLKPDEGFYNGGVFKFTFKVGPNYPHEAPKVHCDTKIYHPNIDVDGNICLNILRKDWNPVLNLGSIIFGLLLIFAEPNKDDPLNKEAAKVMHENPAQFEKNVSRAIRGNVVDGIQYDRCVP